MRRYKLLRDLPYAKAGEIFERKIYKSKDGLSDYDYLEIKKRVEVGEDEVGFGIKHNYFLDNFDEWFEEIKEDGVDWKPEKGEYYWYVTDLAEIYSKIWNNSGIDNQRWELGNVYRTEEQAGHVRDLQIARTKIRRSSNFVPDWSDSSQPKYCVYYDYKDKCLCYGTYYDSNYGEIAWYATREDVERAIEELEPEYLMHFGVK